MSAEISCGFSTCILSSPMILLFFLFFLSSSTFPSSEAADVLQKGKSIKDGESLISIGEVFQLGFFSPGSSKNRYVGIWYYNNPSQASVWVANREAPVRDRNGSFALTDDGSLVVLDGESKVLWSSNTTLSSSSSNDTSAQLADSGNLALRSGAGGVIWQSFDHPGDMYLPGMQVGLDLRTNVNTIFASWKSADDPSTGRFSMGNDLRRSTQLMIWEGTTPRWRTGPWNGQAFIGIQSMRARSQLLYGFRFSNVEAEQKIYFWYAAAPNTLERFLLTPEGVLEDQIWNEEKKEWQLAVAHPNSDCEVYNHCGKNGVCVVTDASTVCKCLEGYEPKFAREWNRGNWLGGCLRRKPLECQRNISDATEWGSDGFFKMERLKLPDDAGWVANVDGDGCQDVCLRNCSCEAYAFVSGIGCMIWGSGLVDIQQFTSGGQDFYIRLAGSELATSRKTSKNALIASAAMIVLLIIFILILFKCRRKIKELFKTKQAGILLINLGKNNEAKEEEAPELPTYSLQELAVATSNFSHSNMIGQGGFGPVYKGVLNGRKEIAVKRLSMRSCQGMEEFKNEVMLIAKLHHRNLVGLLGCCLQGEEKLLIYEYMKNRSLDGFIFDSSGREQLNWKKRCDIICGIARGLLYLHRDSRLTIIHRDLKTSNILLDKEMNPKISDFGLARIFRGDENPANTKRVVGTYGYMSPEYAMDGLFSVKSDVYSFGVVLLEIVSGKKNQYFLHKGTSTNLMGLAWTHWNEQDVMEFVDPFARDNCSVQEALKYLQIGLLCVQDRPNKRPAMPSVIVMLESESTSLPQPKQPTFTKDKGPNKTSLSSGNPEGGFSENYITNTFIIGR